MAGTIEVITVCLSVAKTTYDIIQTVKANKARCAKVGKQVLSLEEIIREPRFQASIESLGRPPNCLEACQAAMNNAYTFVTKYGKKGKLAQLISFHSTQGAFDDLQEDMHNATSHLHLYVSAQAYAIGQLGHSASSPNIMQHTPSSQPKSVPLSSSAPTFPAKHQSTTAPPKIAEAIDQRQNSVKPKNKASLLSNIESQQLKLSDMKDELSEGDCDKLLVIWVDPRPENNYRMVAKASEASPNVVFITLASTGELVDCLLSIRPLLTEKDDLRVRVVTNTWQPNFGAFEEQFETDKNDRSWEDVKVVTESFLNTKTATLVFSMEKLEQKLVDRYACTEPTFVQPGKGIPWFNNLTGVSQLHRFLLFSTVFFVWREVTAEIQEIYTYFQNEGVALFMLHNSDIEKFFSERPYMASTPMAVICNRYVSSDIRTLKKFAPGAGVFVYTGEATKAQATTDFGDILNINSKAKGGVYTNPKDLKIECMKAITRLTY